MIMKENHFKIKQPNRFMSIVFILMLCFALAFGGCTGKPGDLDDGDFSDDELEDLEGQGESNSGLLELIRGFKATYKTQSDNSAVEDQNDSYLYSVNTQLYGVIMGYLQGLYGDGNFGDYKGDKGGDEINEEAKRNKYYKWIYNNFIQHDSTSSGEAPVFYDTIRTYVYGNNASVSNKNIAWEWGVNSLIDSTMGWITEPFTPDFLNLKKDEIPFEVISTYDNWYATIKNFTLDSILNEVYKKYNGIYALALQMNMYEVLLGKEITKLVVSIDNTNFKTVVTLPIDDEDYDANFRPVFQIGQAKLYDVNEGIIKKWEKLEKEYFQKSSYSGFSKKDADNLISFILNNIIGHKAVEVDIANSFVEFNGATTFNNLVISQKSNEIFNKETQTKLVNAKPSYRNYIANVTHIVYSLLSNGTAEFATNIDLKIGEKNYSIERTTKYMEDRENPDNPDSFRVFELSFTYTHPETGKEVTVSNGKFTATPATFVRDFIGSAFLESGELDDAYKNIPRAEYQSFIMMTRGGSYEFESYIMSMEAYTKDLKMNVVGRYNVHDKETGTNYMFQGVVETIDFSSAEKIPDGDKFKYYDDFEFSLPDFAKLLSSGGEVPNFHVYKNGDIVEAKEYPKLLDTLVNKGYLTYYPSYKGYGAMLTDFINNDDAINAYNGVKDKYRIQAPFNKTTKEAKKANDLIYKTISSSGNYGGISVLDETKVNFSYYELVFDIQKDPKDPPTKDYTFKPAIVLF